MEDVPAEAAAIPEAKSEPLVVARLDEARAVGHGMALGRTSRSSQPRRVPKVSGLDMSGARICRQGQSRRSRRQTLHRRPRPSWSGNCSCEMIFTHAHKRSCPLNLMSNLHRASDACQDPMPQAVVPSETVQVPIELGAPEVSDLPSLILVWIGWMIPRSSWRFNRLVA